MILQVKEKQLSVVRASSVTLLDPSPPVDTFEIIQKDPQLLEQLNLSK